VDVEVTSGEHPAGVSESWEREGAEEGEHAREFSRGVGVKEWGELCEGVDDRVGACGGLWGFGGRLDQGVEEGAGARLEFARVVDGCYGYV